MFQLKAPPKTVPFLILNMAMVLAVIGLMWWQFDQTLAEEGGEYETSDGKLGSVRLMLQKAGDEWQGRMMYGGAVFILEPGQLYSDKDFKLKFATKTRANSFLQPHEISFEGQFQNDTVSGIVTDMGGLYPLNLDRNPVYTVVHKFLH